MGAKRCLKKRLRKKMKKVEGLGLYFSHCESGGSKRFHYENRGSKFLGVYRQIFGRFSTETVGDEAILSPLRKPVTGFCFTTEISGVFSFYISILYLTF